MPRLSMIKFLTLVLLSSSAWADQSGNTSEQTSTRTIQYPERKIVVPMGIVETNERNPLQEIKDAGAAVAKYHERQFSAGEKIQHFFLALAYNSLTVIDRIYVKNVIQKARLFVEEIERSGITEDVRRQRILLDKSEAGGDVYAEISDLYFDWRTKEIAKYDAYLKRMEDAGYNVERIDGLAFVAALRDALASDELTPYVFAKSIITVGENQRQDMRFAPMFLK